MPSAENMEVFSAVWFIAGTKKRPPFIQFLQIINEENGSIVLILPGGLTKYTRFFSILGF
jgi:hypothetical protein